MSLAVNEMSGIWSITSLCLPQISNSFGNMDPFGTGQTLPPLQLPQTAAPPATVTPLKKPPKWIRRPVGASFAVSPVSLLSMTLRIEHLCFSIPNTSYCFASVHLVVWWEAGFSGEHKAEPSAASAAHGTHCTYQPGCYRNGLFEALRSAAGHSECRQLCGFLPGEDRCIWRQVQKDCLVFPQGVKIWINVETYYYIFNK